MNCRFVASCYDDFGFFRPLQAQFRHHLLQVFPKPRPWRWDSAEDTRMVGRHELVAAHSSHCRGIAKFRASFQQRFSRRTAPRHTIALAGSINLPQQIRRACGHFIRLRRAIFRRPAFTTLPDVNVPALQAHGFDHLRQQLAGPADKWDSPADLRRRPGPSPDKHELGLEAAIPNQFCCGPVQFAGACNRRCLAIFKQRVVFNLIDASKSVGPEARDWARYAASAATAAGFGRQRLDDGLGQRILLKGRKWAMC